MNARLYDISVISCILWANFFVMQLATFFEFVTFVCPVFGVLQKQRPRWNVFNSRGQQYATCQLWTSNLPNAQTNCITALFEALEDCITLHFIHLEQIVPAFRKSNTKTVCNVHPNLLLLLASFKLVIQ